MLKKLLLGLVCTSILVQASEELEAEHFEQIETVTIEFAYRDFNGTVHEIQRAFVDPVSKDDSSALSHLVIKIIQSDNGEYKIKAGVK
jgi:hypothetical protein